MSDPILRLGGRQPVENVASSATEPFIPKPYFELKMFDDPLHRATVELELAVGASRVTGRIDDLPDATASFRTPEPIQTVSLHCGIVYADASDEKLLTAEVANVSLVACP